MARQFSIRCDCEIRCTNGPWAEKVRMVGVGSGVCARTSAKCCYPNLPVKGIVAPAKVKSIIRDRMAPPRPNGW